MFLFELSLVKLFWMKKKEYKTLNLKTHFPSVFWFKSYQTHYLKNDIFAGLTVALILIPQSMAYAQLAGLPAYYGLYASMLPPVIAAFFGSSRQMATGPVAVVSLMTAVALEPLATAGSDQYVIYAVLLSLMVGVFQFLLGTLNLGMLVNFLSHPVINGFTNAAAIIIATAQLPKLFGVHVDKGEQHYETIVRVIGAAIHYTHLPTLAMGVFAFIVMVLLKKVSGKIPEVLVAVVLTILLSWWLGYEKNVYIDTSAIGEPVVTADIREFNTTLKKIDSLVSSRARLNSELADIKDPRESIVISTRIAFLNLELKKLRNSLKRFRKRLRSVLLVRQEPANGPAHYVFMKNLAGGAGSDERVWRVKAGNRPISERSVLLTAGGDVVGTVPRGLPTLSAPEFNLSVMGHLVSHTVIIALLGFMEAISIAKAMAAKTGQTIDPNLELKGQGLANILGSFTNSYPCAGSFSRSAVNLQSGAVSPVSSLVASLTVLAGLFVLTPLLYYLPQSVLAAIIMVAVVGLINVHGFIHAWKVKWYDGVISVITFAATLWFAPHLDMGVMIGVVLSIGVFLYKSMRPTVVSLAPGSDHSLHNAVLFGLKQCRYIDVVRFDGPLFFANASWLEDQIRERRTSGSELKHIIIAGGGINDIDASGEETLALIVDRLRSAGIDISFSQINESVIKSLEKSHLLAKIGEDHFYPSMKTAVRAVYKQTHREKNERGCPLEEVYTEFCADTIIDDIKGE